MFFKSKPKFIIILLLFMAGTIFYGCVEEPVIDPVKTPYAVLRVGNFSTNVPSFTFVLDDKSIKVDSMSVSNYFDILPGSRLVQIFAPNANDPSKNDTLFNREVILSSYQELSLLFFGQYHRNEELNNFQQTVLEEGTVFESNAPGDKAGVMFIHLNTDDVNQTPNPKSPKIDINDVQLDNGGTKELLAIDIENKNTIEKNIAPGNHQFEFFKYPATTYLFTEARQLAANKRYLVVFAGDATNLKSKIVESDPLPARSK